MTLFTLVVFNLFSQKLFQTSFSGLPTCNGSSFPKTFPDLPLPYFELIFSNCMLLPLICQLFIFSCTASFTVHLCSLVFSLLLSTMNRKDSYKILQWNIVKHLLKILPCVFKKQPIDLYSCCCCIQIIAHYVDLSFLVIVCCLLPSRSWGQP